jgi:hypothetical protein
LPRLSDPSQARPSYAQPVLAWSAILKPLILALPCPISPERSPTVRAIPGLYRATSGAFPCPSEPVHSLPCQSLPRATRPCLSGPDPAHPRPACSAYALKLDFPCLAKLRLAKPIQSGRCLSSTSLAPPRRSSTASEAILNPFLASPLLTRPGPTSPRRSAPNAAYSPLLKPLPFHGGPFLALTRRSCPVLASPRRSVSALPLSLNPSSLPFRAQRRRSLPGLAWPCLASPLPR